MMTKLQEQFEEETGMVAYGRGINCKIYSDAYVEWLEAKAAQLGTIIMPHELNTVELAYKTLVWMIHSGRFDDWIASDIRKKLNDIYGEEVMMKVKKKCLVA